jgi:hypothetical protein
MLAVSEKARFKEVVSAQALDAHGCSVHVREGLWPVRALHARVPLQCMFALSAL